MKQWLFIYSLAYSSDLTVRPVNSLKIILKLSWGKKNTEMEEQSQKVKQVFQQQSHPPH